MVGSEATWLAQLDGHTPRAPDALSVFEPNGLLQRSIPDADSRPAQQEMAIEVESALRDRERLVVEAPTGTGKTYAYLVPSLHQAGVTGRPVWISTYTKSLQTQLQQDFARLRTLGLVEGELAVLKGQANYLCTRDLLAATEADLDPGAAVQLATMLHLLWDSDEGEIGELTDFWLTRAYPGARDIRGTLTLNPATCERLQCDFVEVCPYFAAHRRAGSASLVAVNHALLITELAALDAEDREIAGLVIDEAHTLEDAATSILTVDLDPRSVIAWLDRLIDAQSSSGLLRNVGRAFDLHARDDESFATVLEVVRRTRKAIRIFAERMANYLREFVGRPELGDYPVTHRFRLGIDDRRFLFLEARQALYTFADLAKELTQAVWELHRLTDTKPIASGFNAKALRRRLRAEAARGDELLELSLHLLSLTDDGHVRFATWEALDGETPALVVTRSPIDVSQELRKVYDSAPAVIATSATLSVGGTFDFMRQRLAMPDFVQLQLDDTFDYSTQAALILTRHLPAPRSDKEQEFVEAVADTAIAAIGTAGGGTLGLFTSRRRAAGAFVRAEPGVRYEGLELRAQLPGTSTRELADWFRLSTDGSLFGLRSFWEGFDAPGDTLRLVLIEKLPFPSPADPLVAARSERLEEEGRDPFYEYSVPIAALTFKQGFGRLIRTKTDKGAVVVLDRRLRTGLSYQADVLDSLPEDLALVFPSDEEDFLTSLAEALGVEARQDLSAGVGPRRAVIDLDKTTIRDRDDAGAVKRAFDEILALFGIAAFRPGQEELLRALVVEGRDAVGLLPTGAGKSLVYQAASMALDGLGLVISPLIALMKDQVDGLRNDFGFRWAYALYGGQSGAERDEVLDAVRQGGCRLLYVSPERLRDPILLRALDACVITFVAVDEAHCVSAWGHDFRPDFLSIVPALTAIAQATEVPRVALTATAPGGVLEDIVEQLQLREPLIERHSVDRPNLHFSVIRCRNKKQKRMELLRIAFAHRDVPGIVYCPTRNEAEATAALLRSQDINARHYHAGMPAEQRQAVQDMFMSDQTQVICATNAFGLGVDKPDIGFVVHWALPFSLDSYFQEAGRAARDPDGRAAAVLLWTPSDANLIARLLASTLPTVENLEKLDSEIASQSRPYATVEDLAQRTGLDDVTVRVGVHLLGRAGAISQGPDVASRAFVSIPGSVQRLTQRFGVDAANRVSEFGFAADLGMPGRGVVDVGLVADRLSLELGDLERRLLSLSEDEVIGYRPIQRAMSLTHTSSDWDRDGVADVLRRLRQSSYDRLDSMLAYAKSRDCRRHRILTHFDEPSLDRCDSCDTCVGEPEQLGKVDPVRYADVDIVTEQVAKAIVGLVREASRFGSPLGRGSFVKGLRGVRRWANYETSQVLQRSRHFGALRYLTEGEVNEAIDTLITGGQILEVEHEYSSGGIYTGLDVRL